MCGNIFEECCLIVLSSLINSHPIWRPEYLNCPNTFATFYIVNSKIEGQGKELIVTDLDF